MYGLRWEATDGAEPVEMQVRLLAGDIGRIETGAP